MAIPRLFVSSTCYDLQEIRFQLRNFITDFGYEAVMSEFDDIFYSYESHVQDSCMEEISKCQLFILVVGNNYGSFYHQDKDENKIPDSVTLTEFRKAIEFKVYKHIFVNRYVDYDYKNYKRALDKVTLKYFQSTNVLDEDIDSVRSEIKQGFDDQYHFPYESYRYVFYFLDIVNELKENNAFSTFESFSDIKDSLRKQWAGFMHESLTKKDKTIYNALQPLEAKIDKIERNISKLIENRTDFKDNKLTFDISSLSRESSMEGLEAAQDKIQQLLYDIRYYEVWDEYDQVSSGQRVFFSNKFSTDTTRMWIESLRALTQTFKWSKLIHVEIIFKDFSLSKYNRYHCEIKFKTLFELLSIYNSLDEDDRLGLINTVSQELNKNFEKQAPKKVEEPIDDDLPF